MSRESGKLVEGTGSVLAQGAPPIPLSQDLIGSCTLCSSSLGMVTCLIFHFLYCGGGVGVSTRETQYFSSFLAECMRWMYLSQRPASKHLVSVPGRLSGCSSQAITVWQESAAKPDPVCAKHQPWKARVTPLLPRSLSRFPSPALNSAYDLYLLQLSAQLVQEPTPTVM